jgi:hypothetical protein
MNYQTWIEKQCRMAQSLESGSLDGTYADGAIILCSALGAMASLRWRPTPKTDRKRFIEIVARCRAGGPDTTRVSTALIAEVHPAFGRIENSRYLWERDDKTEADAIAIATAAGIADCKRQIRRYSYATLLYEQVRCGFIHEYQPGKSATDGDQIRGIAKVAKNAISYANNLVLVKGKPATRRLIHFPLEWIGEVALAVARGMDDECSRRNMQPLENLGLAIPHIWWSEAG